MSEDPIKEELLRLEHHIFTTSDPVSGKETGHLIHDLTETLHTIEGLTGKSKLKAVGDCVTVVLAFSNQTEIEHPLQFPPVWHRIIKTYVTPLTVFEALENGNYRICTNNINTIVLTQWKIISCILFVDEGDVTKEEFEFTTDELKKFTPFIWSYLSSSEDHSRTTTTLFKLYESENHLKFLSVQPNPIYVPDDKDGDDGTQKQLSMYEFLLEIVKENGIVRPHKDSHRHEFDEVESRTIQNVICAYINTIGSTHSTKKYCKACIQYCKVVPYLIVTAFKNDVIVTWSWSSLKEVVEQPPKVADVAHVPAIALCVTKFASSRTKKASLQLRSGFAFTGAHEMLQGDPRVSTSIVHLQGERPSLPMSICMGKGVHTNKGTIFNRWAILHVDMPPMFTHGNHSSPAAIFICPLTKSPIFIPRHPTQTIFMVQKEKAQLHTPRISMITQPPTFSQHGSICISAQPNPSDPLLTDEADEADAMDPTDTKQVTLETSFNSFREMNVMLEKYLKDAVEMYPKSKTFHLTIAFHVQVTEPPIYLHCIILKHITHFTAVAHVNPHSRLLY